MKQAKDEAREEIEKYRIEREKQFKEYEAKRMGRKEDVQEKIDANTAKIIEEIEEKVQNLKEPVTFNVLMKKIYYIISFFSLLMI